MLWHAHKRSSDRFIIAKKGAKEPYFTSTTRDSPLPLHQCSVLRVFEAGQSYTEGRELKQGCQSPRTNQPCHPCWLPEFKIIIIIIIARDAQRVCHVYTMHLSMVCPRMGGLGNPRELEKSACGWEFWHPQRSPGWEIWLDRHLEKWRKPGNEWVVRHLGKYPEVIWASFPRPRMAERKVRSIVLLFFKQKCFFMPISAVFKVPIT